MEQIQKVKIDDVYAIKSNDETVAIVTNSGVNFLKNTVSIEVIKSILL